MVKQSYTEKNLTKHTHTHLQKEKKEKENIYLYIKKKEERKSTVAPKVHSLNFGMIRCLFRYSTDAGYIKLIVEI